MNFKAISFDWNHVRAFWVTAKVGSLSGAARALGLTQPTLSRQVAALEQSLGFTLFARKGQTIELTEAGENLLKHIGPMGDAAMNISAVISAYSNSPEGKVSISATELVSNYILPKILSKVRISHPKIDVELTASSDLQNISYREVDIAIRHSIEPPEDLVSLQIAQTTAHLYASQKYIETKNPRSLDDISDCDFLGVADIDRFLPLLRSQGLNISVDNMHITANNSVVLAQMAKQGLGVTILPRYVGKAEPELKSLMPEFSIPISIYLITHPELVNTQRIKCIWDILEQELHQAM